jgi:hypothetical protein
VFTGSKLTSLGLVVRKIKSQNIFSYDWVHDAIVAGAKDKAERKLKVRLQLCAVVASMADVCHVLKEFQLDFPIEF